jgi:hypothetical protein
LKQTLKPDLPQMLEYLWQQPKFSLKFSPYIVKKSKPDEVCGPGMIFE